MPATPPASLAAPALNPNETWWAGLHGAGTRAALAMLETEIAGGRHQRSVYELFAEMEEKDGHLYAVMQTRLNGLLGLERSVQPANDSAAARDVAAFVARAIDNLPRREEFLRALLDALPKGFAAVELLWGYDSAGHLVPVDWLSHPQEFFLFDARGRLLLLAPPFRSAAASPAADPPQLPAARTLLPAASAVRPPARKFIALTFGRDARNPYGRGLCHRAYFFYWFKKNSLKHWAVFNERRRLLEVLEALQTEAGIALPESIQLRFLEAAKSGDGETYRAMAEYCNDEMSKIVLGATLTAGEGRRSGSLALGTIHDAVRQDYIEADARLLADTVNATLVRWLVELNFGAAAPMPQWTIDAAPPEDLEQQARIDRELVALGVPIGLSHFYRRYGRPVPADDERVLAYDDSNLYQYHLRYGVLTINEVRRRLHLPPVAWGDKPARDLSVASRGLVRDSGPGSEIDPEHETESEPREL